MIYRGYYLSGFGDGSSRGKCITQPRLARFPAGMAVPHSNASRRLLHRSGSCHLFMSLSPTEHVPCGCWLRLTTIGEVPLAAGWAIVFLEHPRRGIALEAYYFIRLPVTVVALSYLVLLHIREGASFAFSLLVEAPRAQQQAVTLRLRPLTLVTTRKVRKFCFLDRFVGSSRWHDACTSRVTSVSSVSSTRQKHSHALES